MCTISLQEWLQRPASVGRAVKGVIHLVGEDQQVMPAGETGLVYFGNGGDFHHHLDPDKTTRALLPNGWTTFGDIGYVSESAYLFLADRRDFVIISGGVNIYSQEAENRFSRHPAVADVAVFGIPNEEFGEEVMAVVKAAPRCQAGPDVE